jgi:N-acetylmuramoyl-L-alanine amidase
VEHVDELPADPGQPVVLRQGEELLVPVRAIVELGEGKVDWDERGRTLTITPTVRRLELKEGEGGLEVKVEASAPVKITSLQLANPNRLVIDMTPAWFRVEDVPQPAGVVRAIRLGQFTKETARVVMELTGGPVRVTGLPHTATTITARVQSDGATEVARTLEPGDGPATVITPRGAPARPRSGRAPRRKLSVPRRGVMSDRSGLLRRDLDIFRESGDGLLAGKVICIDPGHGGWKFGAQGQNGLKEGDACLAMGLQVARALREAGATVLMTRDTDMHVGLPDRYNLANARSAHLFISIHCNAFPRRGAMSGTETY